MQNFFRREASPVAKAVAAESPVEPGIKENLEKQFEDVRTPDGRANSIAAADGKKAVTPSQVVKARPPTQYYFTRQGMSLGTKMQQLDRFVQQQPKP